MFDSIPVLLSIISAPNFAKAQQLAAQEILRQLEVRHLDDLLSEPIGEQTMDDETMQRLLDLIVQVKPLTGGTK